jgi:energy-coupling factor transporter ATP-binding protein EcfA2
MIIGIVGKKGSGKDTLYSIIRGFVPSAERVAFGDGVKEELAQACGVSVAELEAQKERYRAGLQWWGTEFRRGNDQNYWIRRTQQQIGLRIMRGASVIIVTDVRFPDEVSLIERMGGILLKIVRPGLPEDPHSSERLAGEFISPFTIHNDGTLDDLRERVADLLHLLMDAPTKA